MMTISDDPQPDPQRFERKRKAPEDEPFRARLKVFVEMCRAFGITPVLMTQPQASNIRNELTPDWTDPTAQNVFNQAIREVGKETGAEIIDLAAMVAREATDIEGLKRIFFDGSHVTDYGSQLYARFISQHLYGLLVAHDGAPAPLTKTSSEISSSR
jgi:hypothetical protein